MANPEHLKKLREALEKKDIQIWNQWLEQERLDNSRFTPDLSGASLAKSNLSQVNLSRTSLVGADLSGADLSGAMLTDTILSMADLSSANMYRANMPGAILFGTVLRGTTFEQTGCGYTILAGIDLSTTNALDTVRHSSSSTIGIDTLYLSQGNIPEVFLRGCGVPETMITFAKSLVNSAIEYYSAFISYSSADEHFAKRLHNDLQMNGVRVWFAPEDLKTGAPLKQTIEESIKLYDKLILVLSEDSIHSAWVHHEFANALRKEKDYHKLVLFPIRLDDSVFHTTEQWAYEMRQRHIGDFRDWTNPLKYQAAFNRLLKDLNTKR